MLDLIKQLFDSLMGSELASAVILILAFAVVASMVGKFLELLRIKGNVWSFAVKICIAFIALSALGGFEWTLSLS